VLERWNWPPGTGWLSAPVHPLLLAAFPVLFLFSENAADQLVLDPLWPSLLLSVAGALVVLLVSVGILRDWIRGSLVATLIVVLFFSFGHVWLVVAEALGARRYLAAPYAIIALAGLILIWRGGRWTVPVVQFANVMAVVLVAFNIVRIADFAAGGARTEAALDSSEAAVVSGVGAETRRPDVYYIVLDRYANTETLDRLYSFDNRPFLDELERRGFTLAEDSWANYFRTAPSLLSTFSMEYLDGATLREEDQDPPTMAPVHRRLQRQLPVPATFKALGYEYIHIGSWWYPTSRNVDADLELVLARHTEFGTALLRTTALMLLEPAGIADQEPETQERPEMARRHTLFAFDRLAEAVRRPGPTFVFAHLLVPHPPYVFSADGSPVSDEERRARPREELYVDQLRWANQQLVALIDQMLAVPSGDEPIIILQADEGPYPRRFQRERADFDWLSADPDEILEKYGILNAMYLPGVDPEAAGIHPRLSPVNTFRIVFGQYFGADLPMLPDRVYLTPNYARMYDFVEHERD
jgi:hypothetical protein